MKRSYNFTGRKKLDNAAFDIRVFEREAAPSELEVKINSDAMPKLDGATVTWVEAYRGARTMRFRLGLRALYERGSRLVLNDFDPNEPLLFRIKIVSLDDPKCRILAWCDRIRPVTLMKSGQRKRSVLPVRPKDLQDVAWEIDWGEPFRPVLNVNSRINEAKSIASIVKSDPDFAALVFPEVIREVLTALLLNEADEEEDATENEWLVFGESLVGESYELHDDDKKENERAVKEWVCQAVQAFGRKAELISRYKAFKMGSN